MLLLWITMGVYALEGESIVAGVLFLVYVPEWVLWWMVVYGGGVAMMP